MTNEPQNKPKRFKPDHIERFEQHLKQIQLSRTDDFVIDSIKLTFYAGWAAAMDSLSQGWFEGKAERVREELQGAVDRLQKLERAKAAPKDNDLDFNFLEEEKVQTSYLNFKVD